MSIICNKVQNSSSKLQQKSLDISLETRSRHSGIALQIFCCYLFAYNIINNNNENYIANYYQGQYAYKIHINEESATSDFLSESSILIHELDNETVYVFGLCLLSSGIITTLINMQSVPPCWKSGRPVLSLLRSS